MNRLGRAVLNSPARARAQRRHVVPILRRLGGDLDGCDVLEVGCGRGVGAALALDVLHARSVRAIDLDPAMVRRAARRLGDRAEVGVGDMRATGLPAGTVDAVLDLGAVHLEPEWRAVLEEVRRVLRPGGRLLFEEIVRPGRQALSVLATGRRLPGDLTEASLLAALDAAGFTTAHLAAPRAAAVTGTVGDLIGVATLRAR